MSAAALMERLRTVEPLLRRGAITRLSPTHLEANGPGVPIGTVCRVEGVDETSFMSEVVAVTQNAVLLTPLTPGATRLGAQVEALPTGAKFPVGDTLLGRVVDALGQPIDGNLLGLGPLSSLETSYTSPLVRTTPKTLLETGVRGIDGLLPIGRGQRVGLFAPSGAGKTTLMAQLASQVAADRVVICLVGERGREVEALWTDGLSAEAKTHSVVVAATSDQPAAFRVRAVRYALALCDHWRAEGEHVFFLLDSASRLAMALRELGLAAGEPPAVRGFTPSVFSTLPQVVERCGALRSGGSTSAVMTVLSDTDDADDPICEVMKSLLDGHIILSRELASLGCFPAIDISRSISRLAPALMSPAHRDLAEDAGQILGTYESSKLLIETGVYVFGTNPAVDRAIRVRPRILEFLKQSRSERAHLDQTLAGLAAALAEPRP